MVYKLIPTVLFLWFFAFNCTEDLLLAEEKQLTAVHAEDLLLAEEKQSSVVGIEDLLLVEKEQSTDIRIEDYLDPYDEGAFEELEEYYDNLERKKSEYNPDKIIQNTEDGNFFFFYSINEKYKGLRQRCKTLVLLLFISCLWVFIDKRLRRRTCFLSGV